jgi:hypothetical protein
LDAGTQDFVEDAKRVRDYGIRSGSLPNTDLIEALVPFDGESWTSEPKALAALRKAALSTFSVIDPITLRSVLHGVDPTLRDPAASKAPFLRRVFSRGNVLIGVAIVVIALAFHYTYWARKADAVLATAREIGQTDYPSQMRRMVEVALLVEASSADSAADETIPNIFNTEIASFVTSAETLQFYQVSQQQFLVEAAQVLRDNSPFLAISDSLRGTFLRAFAGMLRPQTQQPGATGPSANDVPPDLAEQTAETAAVDAVLREKATPPAEETTQPAALRHYRGYLSDVDRISSAIGLSNIGLSNFAALRATQLNYQKQIVIRTEITNRWVLPMLYGALGAIVYSIVRLLNPFLVSPPLRTSLLRVLFGAFTGITISMLFGPASLFDLGGQPIAASLLLICFLFGYSIDSFLALLRRGDDYLSSALKPAGSEKP